MTTARDSVTFCAAQLGHSAGMLLGTYARWLDGAHNALEMRRLETALGRARELTWKKAPAIYPRRINQQL